MSFSVVSMYLYGRIIKKNNNSEIMLKVNQMAHPSLLDSNLFLQGAVGLVFQEQSDPGGRGQRGKKHWEREKSGTSGTKTFTLLHRL